MSYWQHVQWAAGMDGHFHWVLLACVVAAFVLAAVVPEARRRLRVALLLVLLSLFAILICATLSYRGTVDRAAAGFRWTHFAAQLLLAIAIINLTGVLLFRVLLARLRLQPASILQDTLLGLAYIVVAIMLLGRHGVDLTGIVATSAVVTAVIGFSLQDTLGNVMGGVALQMERSIGVGDWIRLGELEGLVREIRWRHTSIETRNWDTVVIPNSVLMKSQVTVLGRREGKPKLHRMWVHFNVDFRHNPPDVIDAVEQALRAEAIPNVAADPPPDCLLNEFKESYAAYAVRYWLSDFAKDSPTSSEIRTRIFVALRRAGIGVSIPAQSVFMTMESRTRDQRKQQQESERRADALRQIAILKPLTDAERAEVAGGLTVAPFRKGEIITGQGNEAHYLYVITKGEAEVRVASNGESRQIATLSAGEVFGEMGMLTGEPRLATVVALTDVICYRLGKETFADIMRQRPEIAESISCLLAERRIELEAATSGLNDDARRQRIDDTQSDLLRRMRKFFTLG